MSKFFKVIFVLTCFLSITFISYAAPMNDLLFNSAMSNNVDMIKVALDNGADINARLYCDSALNLAIIRKNFESTSYLILRGASLDKALLGGGRNNKSNLMYAVDNNDYLIAKLLIDSGENVNTVDSNGNTALSYYLYKVGPKANIVELLTDAHTNTNKQNKYGETALIMFTKNSAKANGAEIACLQILLRAGADPSIKDNTGKTALAYAIERNNLDAIKILLPISPKN